MSDQVPGEKILEVAKALAQNSEEQQPRKGKPRGRPWPKGVSGNPGGRPREVGHVRELARQHTETAIKTLVEIATDPGQPGRARVAAAEALLNRAWGKPPQALDVEANIRGPVISQEVGVAILQALDEVRRIREGRVDIDRWVIREGGRAGEGDSPTEG